MKQHDLCEKKDVFNSI